MGLIRPLSRLGITAKLLLMNILIFLVFGVIFAVIFFSFRNIEDLLTTTVARDVDENISNSGLLRDLSAVFADANLLASTFFKQEDLLKTKGDLLISKTKALEEKSTHKHLKESLDEFSLRLRSVFEQCAHINETLRQLDVIEGDIDAKLHSLEKIVSGRKVDLVLAGEDPIFMEQIAVLLSGYRETFFQVNILFMRARSETLSSGGSREKAVLKLIADLGLRFQTLTASEPGIAAFGPRLTALSVEHEKGVIKYFASMEELRKRLSELEKAKAVVIIVMKEIDENIAKSTANMRNNIADVMQSARTSIILLSVGVMLLLGSLTFVFILSNIRKPMRAINEGIESIRTGNLDTRIALNRGDEWSVIENALNRMARDLNSSYEDLRDKNMELEATQQELQGKINELVMQSEARKRLEEQLHQVQKMEAIGTLAGGIAHDFNNILTAIIGYGSLLRLRMEEGNPLRSLADDILSSSERAAKLTQRLLAFSRKQIISPRPVSLNEIVRRIHKLLVRVIGEDIEFKTTLSDRDLTVMADSGQIEQVLMNLAANARDAMPDGGILTMTTESAVIGSGMSGSLIPPGEYAVLSVSDTGKGMDEETRQRIFEPFFTTKEMGKGTGLGLSIAYGIIKQHNGEINVYSEPGKGTTFKIYLKLVGTKSDGIETGGTLMPTGGTETVLVAEDDPDVRKFMVNILQEYGYTVIEAVDGEDAVRKFIDNKDRIQLLIFDVVMPKKNGKEAYEEICKVKDDVPILYSSGYTADIILNKGILEEGFNFISKPVMPAVLLKKIRETVDN